VPIEPDGSVVVRVPANVAFQLSITDSNGRRIYPLHRNWLQLRPGETRKCNGCHSTTSTTPPRSHGRDGLFAQAWAGATTTGAPFTNTEARFSPNSGETMAQTRARWSRINDNSRSTIPSMDVKFSDEWTDPVGAGRAKDASFSYLYADLTTPLPTSAACTTLWASTCRGVINYVRHIHPLWSKPRQTLAADMVTVLTDHTCTGCHSKLDAANAARVPAGNFDLADGDSNAEPLQKEAYRQLLFARNEVELVGGAVVPRVVTSLGPNGQPQQNNVSLAAPMSAGNARGSGRFFDRFAVGGTHANYLTTAELRLLSEWVDIGAQYFNNPFDPAVPLN
jgi:Hydrazine synthase alpha subunit middle domain